jgi:alkaline phosphatase D
MSLTRRRLLSGAGTAVTAAILIPDLLAGEVATAAKRAGRFRTGRFAEGVISGDPEPTAITLWTRVDGVEGAGSLALEVATDSGFRKVVARKDLATSGLTNHTAKARITGLKPYEEYFYRFATKTTTSRTGRFRTALPADSNQPVKFAFFSCQDYTHGFYNAHAALAREDVDFVVCLGDYIYAEAYHSKKGGTGVRDDKIGRARTLADYRDKYSLYRSDAHLRDVHAAFPMITTWDDHEVIDNYAGNAVNGGLPAGKQASAKQKAAAYQAFFESMPFRPAAKNRVYRSLRFGKTVDLVMMDQRQYRDNQPCDDAVAPACADYNDPRRFLGRTQMDWVKDHLSSSPAAWKIMGNEVTMMPTKVLGDSFYTFDSWQGYPTEREELLTHIKDKQVKDVVWVTGDIHTFIAGDVRTEMGAGESTGVEFVGGSITSQSLGETDLDAGSGTVIKGNDAKPATAPSLINALRDINPWVDVADFDHHGYGLIEARTDGLRCDLVRMSTIKKKTAAKAPITGFRYDIKRGQTSIKGVNGPPAKS